MGACLSAPRTAETAVQKPPSRKGSNKGGKLFNALLSGQNLQELVQSNNILGEPHKSVDEDYEIGKELGRGLFGVTRVAKNRKTGEEFACKSINKVYADDIAGNSPKGKNKKRMSLDKDNTLKKEAEIMRHLSESPHVASLIACYEDEQYIHFVMELCTGGMLYDSITEKGQYSEKQAAAMVRNMVMIVKDLHSRGVMHRDLKLENFLLANKEEGSPLKVIDFGLSTFFTPGQRFAKIVGSAYYVAPEVLLKNYGPEADIWSIGVILYMLLCGVPPFWDVSEAGICAAVLKGEFDMVSDPWPSISESAKDLLSKILTFEPTQRISADEILEHEWVRSDGVASDSPIQCAVYNRVKQFIFMNRMKRHAMAVIAEHCLDPSELSLIQEKFQKFDVNNDGVITLDELITGVQSIRPEVSTEELTVMFEAADKDGSGTLDLSEYASAIMIKRVDDKRIKKAFEYFDKENKGYISRDDLKEVFQLETHTVIEQIVAEVDKNNDGKIDFDEFALMMREGADKTLDGKSFGPMMSKLGEYYACGPAVDLSISQPELPAVSS